MDETRTSGGPSHTAGGPAHTAALAAFARRNGLARYTTQWVCACWMISDRPQLNHYPEMERCPNGNVGWPVNNTSDWADHSRYFCHERGVRTIGRRVRLSFPYNFSTGYEQQLNKLSDTLGVRWTRRPADHPDASYFPGNAGLVLVCSPDLDPDKLLA